MDQPTSFHQLGRFVFLFQYIEAGLTELLVLMSRADDETARILVNDLDFSSRVKTTDVMFARFLETVPAPRPDEKAAFHELMAEILKIAARRNEIVHSKYVRWQNIDGAHGLIRYNSRLQGKNGIRHDSEEEMLPENFEADGDRLSLALMAIEKYRLQVIDWLYPV